jgi:endonuclease YncB( thermonuclease family)
MGNETSRTERSIPKVEDYTAKLSDIDFDSLEDRSIMKGTYVARIVNLYDGDTFTAAIYNESGKLEKIRVRVYGSDTPELKGKTSEAGLKAKNEALDYIGAKGAQGLPLGIKTTNYFAKHPVYVQLECLPIREKFGRILAIVRVPNKEFTLSEHLIKLGLASPYTGGTKDQSSYTNPEYEDSCSKADSLEIYRSNLKRLKDLKDTEGYKGETDKEAQFVREVWEYIERTPEQGSEPTQARLNALIMSGDIDRFDRKRIVRYVRDKHPDSIDKFIMS